MSWRERSIAHLRGFWPLNGHARDVMGTNHGILVNTPTWSENQRRKQCIELDGDDAYVNLGDLSYLNAVEKFTIAFWMNQDVSDVEDWIFSKEIDLTNDIQIKTTGGGAGTFFVVVRNGTGVASFIYPAFIPAGSWHHVAVVFDGSQTGDVNRLVVYVDSIPMTLSFVNAIPAATANLSGADAIIGKSALSFDGKLFGTRIFDIALTQDEIIRVMRSHR